MADDPWHGATSPSPREAKRNGERVGVRGGHLLDHIDQSEATPGHHAEMEHGDEALYLPPPLTLTLSPYAQKVRYGERECRRVSAEHLALAARPSAIEWRTT